MGAHVSFFGWACYRVTCIWWATRHLALLHHHILLPNKWTNKETNKWMNECITTNPSTLSLSYISFSDLSLCIYCNSSSSSAFPFCLLCFLLGLVSNPPPLLVVRPRNKTYEERKKQRQTHTSYGELRFCVEATLSCCLQLGCLHWMVSLEPYILRVRLLLFFTF